MVAVSQNGQLRCQMFACTQQACCSLKYRFNDKKIKYNLNMHIREIELLSLPLLVMYGRFRLHRHVISADWLSQSARTVPSVGVWSTVPGCRYVWLVSIRG